MSDNNDINNKITFNIVKSISDDKKEFKFDPTCIRVGRRVYQGKNFVDPKFEGYEPIYVLAKGSEYWMLSPYFLTDDNGVIMENNYQFSKIYRISPKNTERNSYTGKITWQQDEEVHVDDKGNLTPAFFKWRERGFKHNTWVRYPPGKKNMHLCIGSYWPGEPKLLTYVEARIKIYSKLYIDQVRKKKEYQQLIEKIKSGKKILIIEVDGPHGEDLNYYKEKYKVDDNFIQNNTMIATPENLTIMLHDTKYAYGHAYCLAWALLIDFGICK